VFRGRVSFKVFSEDYWGVGNDTPDSTQRQLHRLPRSLETQPYPPPAPAGDQLKSFLMLGLGLSLVYDSRDNLTKASTSKV
jgi:hypothetical protein